MVNEIYFAFPKHPIPTENWSRLYFITCSCNIGHIGETRRSLKTRLDGHHCKVKNEEIYSSFVAFHCWYNHSLTLLKFVNYLLPFSHLIWIFMKLFMPWKFLTISLVASLFITSISTGIDLELILGHFVIPSQNYNWLKWPLHKVFQ